MPPIEPDIAINPPAGGSFGFTITAIRNHFARISTSPLSSPPLHLWSFRDVNTYIEVLNLFAYDRGFTMRKGRCTNLNREGVLMRYDIICDRAGKYTPSGHGLRATYYEDSAFIEYNYEPYKSPAVTTIHR
ncbi:hypothetical protein F503_04360 [Ophiostoma piceae UAMH 11346]|uniref:Uncharacterized protein n=1 Tax=Ophiostoma piceae (strain UAMH 11346) TaxID=1262450 RepID=S3CQB3_OPHP1|nr:hypothetical protein F503_04360 [Ophiostoma piceae UAMH 11346]